ncbi:hypothetical protein [Spiroplasma endosymbiont of Danaus chrysippus]|uniref:hypothetical protein n=1 Tax=Spiroplasma endosymbiont of Danaus chrysippus TaxID=2691041 RepID=UPI00157B4A41|nr:hypothetical protein [Spiroplasma endosymbiont of Danaus chrysippus]
MKKLLTTITLSTLVGTSASNLKQVFANNVINHGFKSNQLNRDISIKNQNNTNPFITLMIKEKIKSSIIISLPNNCIYVGTKSEGLWKSTDGINLEQVINGIPSNIYI